MLKLIMDYEMTKRMLNNCTLKENCTWLLRATRGTATLFHLIMNTLYIYSTKALDGIELVQCRVFWTEKVLLTTNRYPLAHDFSTS